MNTIVLDVAGVTELIGEVVDTEDNSVFSRFYRTRTGEAIVDVVSDRAKTTVSVWSRIEYLSVFAGALQRSVSSVGRELVEKYEFTLTPSEQTFELTLIEHILRSIARNDLIGDSRKELLRVFLTWRVRSLVQAGDHDLLDVYKTNFPNFTKKLGG